MNPLRESLGRVAPLQIVAIVVALVAVVVLFQGPLRQVRSLRQQLAARQQQLTNLEAQNQELLQQVAGLQRERKDLEERISGLRTQLASSSTEMERSRASVQELKSQYEGFAGERARLESQLASTTTERDGARQQLQRLEEKHAQLERSASRFRERLALLDRDYRAALARLAEAPSASASQVDVVNSTLSPSLSTPASTRTGVVPSMVSGAVELPPIVVHKERAADVAPIVGRLIQVNDPHHFIVVDKGRLDGVQAGMIFSILRGNHLVGRATAVRIHPELSACEFLPTAPSGMFQVDDLAVQIGS